MAFLKNKITKNVSHQGILNNESDHTFTQIHNDVNAIDGIHQSDQTSVSTETAPALAHVAPRCNLYLGAFK